MKKRQSSSLNQEVEMITSDKSSANNGKAQRHQWFFATTSSSSFSERRKTGIVGALTVMIVCAVFLTDNPEVGHSTTRTTNLLSVVEEEGEGATTTTTREFKKFDPDTFTLPVHLPPSPPVPGAPPAPRVARSRHSWSREQYDIAKEMNDGESLRAISGQIFGGLDYEVPFSEKPPKATNTFSPCAALYGGAQCAEKNTLPKCVKTMNALPFKSDTWMSLHTGGRNGNEGDLAGKAQSLHGLFANGVEFQDIKKEVDATYGGFPRADWLNNTRKSPGKYALANACALVHSDGKLKGSGLGHRIDKHHLVIRLNDAPVSGHEEDVGSFTSARFLGEKYFRRNDRDDKNLERAAREFPDESLVALHWCKTKQEALHGKANHESHCRKESVFKAAKMKAHLFNPKFVDAVSASLELKEDESPSDFFIALVALTHVCARVHVYGYNLYDKRDLIKTKHTSYLGEMNGKYHLPRRYGNVPNAKKGVTKKPSFEKESPNGYFYAKFNRIAPDQVTIEASGLHKPGLMGSGASFAGYSLGEYKDRKKTAAKKGRKLLSKSHLPMESPEEVDEKEQFCVRALHHAGVVAAVEASGREGGGLYHTRESLTRSKMDMPTHPSQKYTVGSKKQKHG